MTIYECDFCKQQKVCKKLTMDDMEYDICETCSKKMSKQLSGRGQQKPRLVGYYWPVYHFNYWQWPMIQYPQPIIMPTVTWGQSGNWSGVTTGSNCQTLTLSGNSQ